MTTVNAYAKAIVGALIAGLGIIGTALGTDSGQLTGKVWVGAAIAALTALVGVALTTNTPPAAAATTPAVVPVTMGNPAPNIVTPIYLDPATGQPLPSAPATPPAAVPNSPGI